MTTVRIALTLAPIGFLIGFLVVYVVGKLLLGRPLLPW
jgi:hypothetical protein